ncbi:hypothetical protein [Psychrobacillus psychrodurans]|uniref:hypothetical protein n=1 Tax=Psychrobacillus psychrodurans TaxID=126157 RepID=UPI0008E3F12A|nr:hypothetical protein [Psychrobacillus psychrodurans]MCZ8538709.1 hypothetical protein [Psychrobacillus psychrodurans]SFM20399.1 hypothetical protein SAMN05421832_10155 [Psychrobacillus psychrodurans]
MQSSVPNREAEVILINYSEDQVKVLYNSNSSPFLLPKIGVRPPFFYNPRYEQYYPII